VRIEAAINLSTVPEKTMIDIRSAMVSPPYPILFLHTHYACRTIVHQAT
jgi:hypothetical protein